MTMCQYRVISYTRCPTLVEDVDKGGGYACMEARGMGEISVPSSRLCCEPKTSKKLVKSLKKRETRKETYTCKGGVESVKEEEGQVDLDRRRRGWGRA